MEKQTANADTAFEARLEREAAGARQRAQSMPSGCERDKLMEWAHKCERAAQISAWVNSLASGTEVARAFHRQPNMARRSGSSLLHRAKVSAQRSPRISGRQTSDLDHCGRSSCATGTAE
jgi:hypothetical protein